MKKTPFIFFSLLLIGSVPVTGCRSSNYPGTNLDYIELNEESVSIVVGKTFQLRTKENKNVTWTIDNPNIASINQNGLVTALKVGTTVAYATNEKEEGYCVIKVIENNNANYHVVNTPNPEAEEIPISRLASMSAADYKLYRIKGIVEANTYSSKGVFDISDGTGYIEVYGASVNKSCISKSGNSYSYIDSNGYSSLDGKIKAGDEVTLEGVFTPYQSYTLIREFQGYVVDYLNNNVTIPNLTYTQPEPTYTGSYYNDVDLNASGNQLYKNLQDKMFNTHNFSSMSYSGLYNGYQATGEYSGSNYVCFYTNKAYPKSKMNREHVWCQSLSIGYPGSPNQLWGETGGGCDLHHVRPANAEVNSERSNIKFGQLVGLNSKTISTNYSTPIKYTTTIWEVPDNIKGDVARILLYTYMHYNSAFSSTSGRMYTGELALRCIVASTTDSEALKLLKYWNALDPVDAKEMQRNEGAFQKQKNRNPFIDHPKLVDKLV